MIMKNKTYWYLILGLVISSLGTQIYDFSVSWYILDIYGNAMKMSLYLSIGIIIRVMLGPLIAVYIDRCNKLKLVIISDFIIGLICIFSACIIFFIKDYESQLIVLYINSIVLSIFSCIYSPSFSFIFKKQLQEEELMSGNSIRSMVQNSRIIVGSLIAGLLYSYIGIVGILIINGMSYIISAMIECFIPNPESNNKNLSSSNNNFIRDFKEGFQYLVKQKQLMRILIIFSFYNLISYALNVISIPFLFNQIFKSNATILSSSKAVYTIGLLIMSYVLSRRKTPQNISRLINFGLNINIFSEIILIICIFLSENNVINYTSFLILFYILYFAMGFTLKLFQIPFDTMVQKMVDDEVFGKVISLIDSTLELCTPIAAFLTGIIIDLYSFNTALLFISLGLGITLILIKLPINLDSNKNSI